MSNLENIHDRLLDEKREELIEIIQACLGEIHSKMEDSKDYDLAKGISNRADQQYDKLKEDLRNTRVLA